MRDDVELIETRETDQARLQRGKSPRQRLRFRAAHQDALIRRADEWFEYACDCEADGDLNAAAAAFRRVIVWRPECAEAHFNLGNVLRALGEFRDAERHFRRATQCNPRFAQAWYNLADVLENRGESQQAVACLERAILLDPLFANAHFNLARCYEEIGDFAAAARHWSRYLILDPQTEWAREAQRSLSQCAMNV